MNRVLFIVVTLLLAFAAGGGPALAYAQGGGQSAVAADPVADRMCVAADGAAIASYQPCEKRTGAASLCPELQLMPGETVGWIPRALRLREPPGRTTGLFTGGAEGVFRPPRAPDAAATADL